jgi:hypothetical protein
MREFGSKTIRKSTRAETHAKSRLRKTTRQRRWLPRPSLRAEPAMQTIFEDEFYLGDVDVEAVVVVGVLVVGVVLLFVFVE